MSGRTPGATRRGSGGTRSRLAYWLQIAADRIDPDGAPRRMSYSFTFERGRGVAWNDEGRGCPVWYFGRADYERAHEERVL